MYKKIVSLSLILGIITYQFLFAQQRPSNKFLSLKREQFSMPNRKFYIQKIVCDFNQPKYFLIRKGLFGKQMNMTLEDSVQKVLLRYLRPTNTYSGGLVPVLLRVKELKIREERHFLNEEGTAKISMEFYVETDTKPVKIFQSNAFRTYSGFMNVTNQHDENVREVIKSCLIDFNNAKIDYSKYVIPKIFKAKRNMD